MRCLRGNPSILPPIMFSRKWDAPFEDKLSELKHYKTEYANIDALLRHFGDQLDKLAASGFRELAAVADPETQPAAPPGASTVTVTGDRNVVGDRNTVTDSSKTYHIEKIDSARFE